MCLVTIGKAEKPVPLSSYMLHDDCYSYLKLVSASANFDRSSLGFGFLLDCRAIENSARGVLYSIRIDTLANWTEFQHVTVLIYLVTPLSDFKVWPGDIMSSCRILSKC